MHVGTAIHQVHGLDPVGVECLEGNAAPVVEGLSHPRRLTQQRGAGKEQAAHEMVRALRGHQVGVFLREREGIGRLVVLDPTGGRHPLQPFLDIAAMQPGSIGQIGRRGRAGLGQCIEQSGPLSDIAHSDAHGPGHVPIYTIGEPSDAFLLHAVLLTPSRPTWLPLCPERGNAFPEVLRSCEFDLRLNFKRQSCIELDPAAQGNRPADRC